MKTPLLLLGLAIVILALGGFISYTTGRYEAMLYALVGAMLCAVLILYMRRTT